MHLRGRYGSDALWPRSSQRFEALSAYVDFQRRAYRVRAGRQPRMSGLGLYRFDGASVLWRGWKGLRVEAFAGRSLGGSLDQYRTGSLLADADRFAPDTGSILWGIEGKARLGRRLSGSLLYQRELRTDRMDMYTERVAFDGRWTGRPLTADLSLRYDVAFGQFNEARLRLQRPVSRTVVGKVLETGQPEYIKNVQDNRAFSPSRSNGGYAHTQAYPCSQPGNPDSYTCTHSHHSKVNNLLVGSLSRHCASNI